MIACFHIQTDAELYRKAVCEHPGDYVVYIIRDVQSIEI
jgi:hypothetical protein